MLGAMKPDHPFVHRLSQRLAAHRPRVLDLHTPRAGVLVPLVAADDEPGLLLTVRAAHLKSHPGQIAFPGGMWEPRDADLAATALRETEEELNIPTAGVQLLGPLSTGLSKDGVQVFPQVGLVGELTTCRASPDEIADWFVVPWSFFAATEPELVPMQRHGIDFQIPHYRYQGHHIWGLTAMILLELINLVEDTDWPLPAFAHATRPGYTPGAGG